MRYGDSEIPYILKLWGGKLSPIEQP